jgi:hypothetical protein
MTEKIKIRFLTDNLRTTELKEVDTPPVDFDIVMTT